MHERLSEAAAKNERSLSEEIEKRLEASFLFDERIRDLQTLWKARCRLEGNGGSKSRTGRRRYERARGCHCGDQPKSTELEKEAEASIDQQA